MTDTIRTRDERRQERSYQQLELSHLSYVIQWRYDKAREIAGQIEVLYVDGAETTFAEPPDRRSAKGRQHSRRQNCGQRRSR